MPKVDFKIQVLAAQAVQKRVRQAELVAVAVAGNQLRRAIIQNISIPPIGGSPATHKAALRRLGHPYSTRFRKPQIKPSGGFPGFGKRELLVHTVSGRMRSAVRGVLARSGGGRSTAAYQVNFDSSVAPHAKYVVHGTKVMLPRDILRATAADPAVRQMLRRTVVRVFGKTFRTQSALRIP